MMRRRHIVSFILAALFAGLFTASVNAQELKFGFTPVLSEPEMRTEFEPLMNYLSESLGQKVTLYIAKDYGDLRTQMENGSVDIGSFSPFAYVDAARGGKIRIIAQSIIEGSATGELSGLSGEGSFEAPGPEVSYTLEYRLA